MGFFRYVKEAFNARPWGMWLPPNWVAVAAFGLLGLLNAGLWVVGAGLELGYLLMLSNNVRFQRLVDSRSTSLRSESSQQQIATLVARLDASDQARYRQLEQRCQNVLQQQHEATPVDLQMQADGFGKLVFVYLKLLLTREAIMRVLDGAATQSLDKRIAEVNEQLKAATSPELQHSLTDQLSILDQRKKRHAEAREKLKFIEAELTRIQEQVELIREGTVITSDPAALSSRIDQVGGTLNNTTQWIKDQQDLLGGTEDLLNDPPPITLRVPLGQKA